MPHSIKTRDVADYSTTTISSSLPLLHLEEYITPVHYANDNQQPQQVGSSPRLAGREKPDFAGSAQYSSEISQNLIDAIARAEIWQCSMCRNFRINPYGPTLPNSSLIEQPCDLCGDAHVTGADSKTSASLHECVLRGLL